VAVFAPDHHLDHLVRRDLGAGLIARHIAAVAEHRAIVGQFGDLVHAVRDVEERQAFVAQALQHGEDLRTSPAVSAEVASSRMRMRGLRASALAISTIWRRDSGRSLTSASGMDVFRAGARQRLLGDAPLGLAVDHAEAARRIGE
jgi:hypothetical protein